MYICSIWQASHALCHLSPPCLWSSLLYSQAFLPLLFADEADPSHQFVSSSPMLPCTSDLRLHSTKDKMSVFSHLKDAGQRTAALKKIKEGRGALECPAGEMQQRNSYFWNGFPFPSSKSSWQQPASLSRRLQPPKALTWQAGSCPGRQANSSKRAFFTHV